TRTAQYRLRPYLHDLPLEHLARDSIDSDIRLLAHLHVDNVSFVYLDFRRDGGHVGKRHQKAAVGVLDSRDNVVADTFREIAHNSIDRRRIHRFAQNVLRAREHRTALIQLLARLRSEEHTSELQSLD